MASAKPRAAPPTASAHASWSSAVASTTRSFTTAPDPWKRRLFVALCRRYGLKPFREPGRRYSTVQVRAPKVFHDRTLWPEFCAFADELDAHLDELTTRVIREAINDDVSEPTAETKALPEPTA